MGEVYNINKNNTLNTSSSTNYNSPSSTSDATETLDMQPNGGPISKDQIDFSRISTSASNASAGQYVKVNDNYWGDNGELTYKVKNGVVYIMENGQTLGFTTLDGINLDGTEQKSAMAGDQRYDNVETHRIEPSINASENIVEVNELEKPVPEAVDENVYQTSEVEFAPSVETPASEPVSESVSEPVSESVFEPVAEPAPVPEPVVEAPAPEVSQSIPTAPGVVVEDRRSQYYTVTPYDRFYSKWNSGTGQRAVADAWGAQGMTYDHGIATMNVNGEMRYLVATTTAFGNAGDTINIHLENGTVIPAMIADAKSPGDANWTKYGHTSGNNLNVLEWEVDSSYYEQFGNPSSSNGYALPWDSSSKVVSIENVGSGL